MKALSKALPKALPKALCALAAGTLFGLGLAISGMTNPANVIAFLRLGTGWQPALIFVMGSALLVTFVGYRLLSGRTAPFFDKQFYSPANPHLDRRLLVGATLFGVGWGMSGYCPGPAIVGAWHIDAPALTFLAAYLVGNLAFELVSARTANKDLHSAVPAADG